MSFHRGIAAVAAWLALLSSSSGFAQVEWTRTLNPAATELQLQNQYAVGAADGAVFTSALASDGEQYSTSIRVARIAAGGSEQWVRWVKGQLVGNVAPLIAHADGSLSVVYTASSSFCVTNFAGNGALRARKCFTLYSSYVAVTRAPDDDLIIGYGYQRNITKLSALGVVRWTVADTDNGDGAQSSGIDSSGNYYEFRNGRLRRWSAADGSRLSDVAVAAYTGSPTLASGWSSLARTGAHLIVARAIQNASAQNVIHVSRLDATGAALWSREVVPPASYNQYDLWRLASADGDGAYVLFGREGDTEAQATRLAADGSLLWQVQYPRTRRLLESGNLLVAVSSVANASNSGSDAMLRAVSPLDGSLGPSLFRMSRADLLVPREWFAVNGGLIATYQGYNPVVPMYSYPLLTTSLTEYAPVSSGSYWAVAATGVPARFAGQSNCLMPRLAASNPVLQAGQPASSPNAWWARTQSELSSTSALSDWSKHASSDGTRLAGTTPSAAGCGVPITSDAGRVVVSPSQSTRARRFDSSGTALWTASSGVQPSSYWSTAPVQLTSRSNVTTYAVGGLVGRVSAAGVIAFESDVATNASPRYLGLDADDNTWVVSSGDYGDGIRVRKLSPAGATLWNTALNPPGCSDTLTGALLTSAGEMLMASQSCGEGRLYKLGADGQLHWQRILNGTQLRPFTRIQALHVDSSGNYYAAGCIANSDSFNANSGGVSAIASWTNSGSERWNVFSDLIGGAPECVTSLTGDAAGNLFAASSINSSGEPSAYAVGAPVLWSLTAGGAERWQHSGVLTNPFADGAEITFDDDGKLIVLGEAAAGLYGSRTASLRRINVATLASGLRLKFLSTPSTAVDYRALFSVRVGLRTAADAAQIASSPVTVRLAMLSGTGTPDGALQCTIAVGASDCEISDLRYNVIETGVVLTAVADGFAVAYSPAISFTAATTTTTLTVLQAPPYVAYSRVRVRAEVIAPPAPEGYYSAGSLSGPYQADYQSMTGCTESSAGPPMLRRECEMFVRQRALPVNAEFTGYNNYLSSRATALNLPVTKAASTLQVVADPGNSNIVGDRVRFRVSLLAASGVNAIRFLLPSAITASVGGCYSGLQTGNPGDGYAGSYVLCEVASPAVGQLVVSFGFAGDDDLLPATPVTTTTTISDGAVIRNGNYLPGSPALCSTTPGVVCSVESNGSDWRCVGPAGISGELFYVPAAPGGYYNYNSTPVRYSDLRGLLLVTGPYYRTQVGACKPDVDGDGATLAMTDGVIILRRMLGITGDALTVGATHSCVPAAGKAYASSFPLAAYDIDGDGQVLAATDGVLMLRYLIGIRGDALVTGAIGAAAVRTSADQVRNFLTSECGLYTY